MSILILADHAEGALTTATLSTVSAAKEIGNDITILVAGCSIDPIVQHCATIEGVTKVLYSDSPLYENGLAENIAPLVVSLSQDYTHVLAPATTYGKNIMPRVAALLDVAAISDITAIKSEDTFERPIYAGNAMAVVQSLDTIKVITTRSTSFEPSSANAGATASIESVPATEDTGLSRFIEQKLSSSDRPELTSAKIVISGGRGMGSSESFALIDKVADKLGAAVGASRAAVDAGYVPNDYQVGQTGKVVAPDLYIAVGISGAIQHLAGMKDSKVIVAINKDEEAPIFQVADYGLVGDLFEELPKLDTALS